jgi:hypothetical protein
MLQTNYLRSCWKELRVHISRKAEFARSSIACAGTKGKETVQTLMWEFHYKSAVPTQQWRRPNQKRRPTPDLAPIIPRT